MTLPPRRRLSPHGFTLVELLVVIAIIGVLVGLLLPAVQAAREAGRRTSCQQNVKQLSFALHNYQDAKGGFPVHLSPFVSGQNRTGVSWLCQVLPFIEQDPIFAKVDTKGASYQTGANQSLGANRIPTFLCASEDVDRSASGVDSAGGQNAFTTHYVGSAGPVGTDPTGRPYTTIPSTQGAMACEGVLPMSPTLVTTNPSRAVPVRIKDVTDGTSKTLMVLEMSWNGLEATTYRSWLRGACWNGESTSSKNVKNDMNTVQYTASNFNDVSMGSNHPGGCNVAMADASVRFLSSNLETNTVLLPLASRAGGDSAADN